MRHSLVPVVLLAIVALSLSNVLPMLSTVQLLKTNGIDGQTDDNIISNTLSRKYTLQDIFKELPYEQPQKERLRKRTKIEQVTNKNSNDVAIEDLIDIEDNYDGEGFRKEQWHNYPRQLDRLQDYFYEKYLTYTNPDSNDPDNINYNDIPDSLNSHNSNTATKDFDKNNNNMVEATDPLLLLRLHFVDLQKEFPKVKSNNFNDELLNPSYDNQRNPSEEILLSYDENPALKVKREGTSKQDTYDSGDADDSRKERKSVAKRLFSLWSRLQGLSHKGHELPHRRHIHAFYGLPPDSATSGGFPAEIRRDIRPPGAPLRWG